MLTCILVSGQSDTVFINYVSRLQRKLQPNPNILNLLLAQKSDYRNNKTTHAIFVQFKDDSIDRFWQIGKEYLSNFVMDEGGYVSKTKKPQSKIFSMFSHDSCALRLEKYLTTDSLNVITTTTRYALGTLSNDYVEKSSVYRALEYSQNLDTIFEKEYLFNATTGFRQTNRLTYYVNSEQPTSNVTHKHLPKSKSKTSSPSLNQASNTSAIITYTDKRDGHKYPLVVIGTQTWMAANLSYKPDAGKYWAFKDSIQNISKYGYLYSWEVSKTVCPNGWHLPDITELETMVMNTGGKDDKLVYRTLSFSGNSGFSIIEVGLRSIPGLYYYTSTGFWTSSEKDKINSYVLLTTRPLTAVNNADKRCGLFVRCLLNK